MTWDITMQYYTNPYPGHVDKNRIHVNGQFPPPTIKVQKNSRIEILVRNIDVTDGVSLHAHGLYQFAAPWMDGPVGITQRKIPVGKKFKYIWTTAGQTGTYWVHSHVHGQYPKGLRSPLVIMDGTAADESNAYMGDRILGLTDWFNRADTEVDRIYKDNVCNNGLGKGIPLGPDG